MTQQPEDPPREPPHTGVPAVDEAIGGLTGLDDEPLSDQHDRLAQAHSALQRALDADPHPDGAPPSDLDHPARP